MRGVAPLRLFALLALALVGTLVALVASRHHDNAAASQPVAGGDWYRALASAEPVVVHDRTTVCGRRLGPKTLGIAHPVLPCNAKLYVEYEGHTALAQVIDRGPSAAGREFALTHALAEQLGLHGTQAIRWRFATVTDQG